MPNDGVNRDELYEVCLVFNGSLGMSAGKMAGQAFQACNALMEVTDLAAAEGDYSLQKAMQAWTLWGTRTIVKVATTPAIFGRVCNELAPERGHVHHDEGFTEVEAGAATLFVSYPRAHKDRPRLLDNKKVPLL